MKGEGEEEGEGKPRYATEAFSYDCTCFTHCLIGDSSACGMDGASRLNAMGVAAAKVWTATASTYAAKKEEVSKCEEKCQCVMKGEGEEEGEGKPCYATEDFS